MFSRMLRPPDRRINVVVEGLRYVLVGNGTILPDVKWVCIIIITVRYFHRCQLYTSFGLVSVL